MHDSSIYVVFVLVNSSFYLSWHVKSIRRIHNNAIFFLL
uniref:Uncharacterized protein n=1 Tax=Rhizophora mucronata TaxID=61149 RepID=A0A2P2QQB6_RHIMU